MKVVLPLRRLALLNNTLYTLVQKNRKGNPRFLFAAKTNADRLRDMMKNADEQREAAKTTEYRAYLTMRDGIYRKHRELLGLPADSFDFGDKNKDVEQEILALASDPSHRQAIDEYSEAMQELEAMFGENVEVELKGIALEVLPKNITLIDFVSIEALIEKAYEIGEHDKIKVTLTMNDLVTMVDYLTGIRHMGGPEDGILDTIMPISVCRRLGYFLRETEPIYAEWAAARKRHTSVPEFVVAQAKRNEIMADTKKSMEDKIKEIDQIMSSLPKEATDRLAEIDAEIDGFGKSERTLMLPSIRLSDLPENTSFMFMDLFFPLIDEGR